METKNINKLMILNKIRENALISGMFTLNENETEENLASFCSAVYSLNAQNGILSYVSEQIIYDENVFSVTCAKKITPDKFVKNAMLHDLKIVFDQVRRLEKYQEYLSIGTASPLFKYDWNNEVTLDNLHNFYCKYGYGQFIRYRAFNFDGDKFTPIQNASDIKLSDLKEYRYEKKIIGNNIENFLKSLPFSNMLLYGDRGTGKSSTIHAMLNKYFDDGLRIIEISKDDLLKVPVIRQKLYDNPLKFIIYVDDLSLDEKDERFSGLKAALEGSVSGKTCNTMIVVTSNRRHLINESFSERENSVHKNDLMEEQLSLADRFGISVLFSTTGKADYLAIIRQLAEDLKIDMEITQLELLAERWAIQKGGRSPRRAKQFIDIVYSAKQRGIEIEF